MSMENALATRRPRGWSWAEATGGVFLLVLLSMIFGGATYDALRSHERTHAAVASRAVIPGTRYGDDLLRRAKAQESAVGSALRATLAKEHALEVKIGAAVQRERHEDGSALAEDEAAVKKLRAELEDAQAVEASEERQEEKIVQEELRLLRAKK